MRELHPDKLQDIVWCETIIDIWLYRRKEANKDK